MTRQVVHRVEDGMDREGVEATTYQMRNPYAQMRDGFFSALDVFNYMHHHHIAKAFAKKGNRVLDVCCGRGIMLPLLRYHAAGIQCYVGVDIEPKNAIWQHKRVTDGKPLDEIENGKAYYPFHTLFVESNVAEMAEPVRAGMLYAWGDSEAVYPQVEFEFDLIIYTQSIEHMHPEAGFASLEQCADLAADGCRMVLSGPNTPPDQDGYDARYRAHVYEWKREELLDALYDSGWKVEREWGLTMGVRKLGETMRAAGLDSQWEDLSRSVPSEWLAPVLAPLFPKEADEIAILATRTTDVDQLELGS